MSKNKTKKEASDLNQKLFDLEKHLEEGFTGLIKEVSETTNTLFYGEEGKFSEREGYAIYVKINSPDGTTFKEFMGIPDKVQGLKQSNLYAFKQKYGEYPRKGLEVDCHIDDNGFFKITID